MPRIAQPSLLPYRIGVDQVPGVLAGEVVGNVRAVEVCCCLPLVDVSNSLLDENHIPWILAFGMVWLGMERIGVAASGRPSNSEVMLYNIARILSLDIPP